MVKEQEEVDQILKPFRELKDRQLKRERALETDSEEG